MIEQTKPRPKTADASHLISDFSHGRYPGSVSSDWHKLQGFGLVHKSELSSFKCYYRKCEYSHQWIKNEFASISHENKYISTEWAKANGWWFSHYDSLHFPPSEPSFDAFLHRAPHDPIKVRAAYRHLYLECSVLGGLWNREYMRTVVEIRPDEDDEVPDGERLISPKAYSEIRNAANDGRQIHGLGICSRCGNVFPAENCTFREEVGAYMCDTCYEERRYEGAVRKYDDKHYCKPILKPSLRMVSKDRVDNVGSIKGKSTSPVGGFYVVDVTNPRMLGVEIECGFGDKHHRNKVAYSLCKTLGEDWIFVKHDGSIVANDSRLTQGIEIVSAPADIETHRERWKKFDQDPHYKELRAWDTSSCGMHIHISREALSSLQIGRMAHFIGHPGNQKFVRKVSGRTCEQYARIVNHPLTAGVRSAGGKYEAFRMELPETVELRIFRSTVNYRHIIRNLEFANALCDFCHPAARSLREVGDHLLFLEYIACNRKSYPLFSEWCEVQEFIPRKRRAPGSDPLHVEEANEPASLSI